MAFDATSPTIPITKHRSSGIMFIKEDQKKAEQNYYSGDATSPTIPITKHRYSGIVFIRDDQEKTKQNYHRDFPIES